MSAQSLAFWAPAWGSAQEKLGSIQKARLWLISTLLWIAERGGIANAFGLIDLLRVPPLATWEILENTSHQKSPFSEPFPLLPPQKFNANFWIRCAIYKAHQTTRIIFWHGTHSIRTAQGLAESEILQITTMESLTIGHPIKCETALYFVFTAH